MAKQLKLCNDKCDTGSFKIMMPFLSKFCVNWYGLRLCMSPFKNFALDKKKFENCQKREKVAIFHINKWQWKKGSKHNYIYTYHLQPYRYSMNYNEKWNQSLEHYKICLRTRKKFLTMAYFSCKFCFWSHVINLLLKRLFVIKKTNEKKKNLFTLTCPLNCTREWSQNWRWISNWLKYYNHSNLGIKKLCKNS